MTVTTKVQNQVQNAIDEMVATGAERGLQVAVYKNGKLIADAVAGIADPETGRPVTPATVFYCYSVVKAAAATITHRLVERGLFGYETPVVELWPEFGAHRKEKVTVRQVLNHTAGVPGIPLTTTIEDLCDWDKMCAAIADEELWWEPGTQVGYHAYTFGYIVGEIVSRATGKRISQLLIEEIGKPLGIADEIYFGMPRSEQHRLARLEDAPMPPEAAAMMAQMPADLPMFKAAPMSLMPNAEFGNREDILAADIPAGGKCSARAIARMFAAILGEVDGVRLLTPERMRVATAESSNGMDAVFGMPTKWALGYSCGAFSVDTAFAVGGVGGSFAFGDVPSGIACAIIKNRLAQDFNTSQEIIKLVMESIR
jgi:CubicO group peptidase (beta-lactamase class C family)